GGGGVAGATGVGTAATVSCAAADRSVGVPSSSASSEAGGGVASAGDSRATASGGAASTGGGPDGRRVTAAATRAAWKAAYRPSRTHQRRASVRERVAAMVRPRAATDEPGNRANARKQPAAERAAGRNLRGGGRNSLAARARP